VGPVRRVGDHDRGAGLPALREIFADHQEGGQLAVRAGGRLEGHAVHAADLGQVVLELPQQLERALRQLLRLVRMEAREAGRPRRARRWRARAALPAEAATWARPRPATGDAWRSLEGLQVADQPVDLLPRARLRHADQPAIAQVWIEAAERQPAEDLVAEQP